MTWHCGRHGDLVGCQREAGGGITPKQRGGGGGGWMNPVSKCVSSASFKLRLNVIFVTNKSVSTHFLYHSTLISVNIKLVNIIVEIKELLLTLTLAGSELATL